MFLPGSLHDRLARAVYAVSPTLTAAGDPVGFDLANVLNASEVVVARRQAETAAGVLAEYQELWVHLMCARMQPADEVDVPDLFPDVTGEDDDPVFRRAFSPDVAGDDGYEPRHAGPTLAATLLSGEWTEVL